jgi:hypothetical protein
MPSRRVILVGICLCLLIVLGLQIAFRTTKTDKLAAEWIRLHQAQAAEWESFASKVASGQSDPEARGRLSKCRIAVAQFDEKLRELPEEERKAVDDKSNAEIEKAEARIKAAVEKLEGASKQ